MRRDSSDFKAMRFLASVSSLEVCVSKIFFSFCDEIITALRCWVLQGERSKAELAIVRGLFEFLRNTFDISIRRTRRRWQYIQSKQYFY